jgi:hypothetical protein
MKDPLGSFPFFSHDQEATMNQQDVTAPQLIAEAGQAVAWQRRCNGGAWEFCNRESYEHTRRTGNAGVLGDRCEVRALYAAAPESARDREEYRANFPEQFWDANELLHDYMAYANAPDSGFADESMRLHKLNERAKAMGLNPPKPEGSVT